MTRIIVLAWKGWSRRMLKVKLMEFLLISPVNTVWRGGKKVIWKCLLRRENLSISGAAQLAMYCSFSLYLLGGETAKENTKNGQKLE